MAVSFLLVFFVKKASGQFLLSMIKTRVDWGVRVKGVGVRKPWKKTFPYIAKELQFTAVFEFP